MDPQKLREYRASASEQARTADLLSVLPKGRSSVLDLGAREGHFSKLLTQHFASVIALDLEKPEFEYPGVITVAGNATKLDFPDNAFDCVFCTEVLEHIPELEKACREILRVARHEIIIGVPYQQDIRLGRVTCGACGRISPPWGHLHSFDEKRLSSLFQGAQVVSKSFVGTVREATNAFSVFFMDLAGNPWGPYEADSPCPFCGAKLRRPAAERSLGSKICSALALRINQFQTLWVRPHGNWIHLVLRKAA